MKKILTLIAACVMTLSASAQVVNSNSKEYYQTYTVREAPTYPNYNRIYASYTSMTMNVNGTSSDAMNGFRVGWLGGWNIVKTIPLYLEAGANVQGNFYSDGEGKYKVSDTFLKLNVPVSVAYRFTIPNSSIAISPYAGVHLTGNILAQEKEGDDSYSMFDDEAKRIQFGGQVGVGVTFKTFYLGFEYTPDFTNFQSDYKIKTPSWSATIGLEF